MKTEITFDRFIRMLIGIGILVVIYLLLDKLSTVLMPFLVAWFLAYMLNPVVNFIQLKCKVKIRWLAIIVTFLLMFLVVGGVLWLIIPPVIEEVSKLKDIIVEYIKDNHISDFFTDYVVPYLNQTEDGYQQYFSAEDASTFLNVVIPKLFAIISSSIEAIVGIVLFLVSFIYLFYILLDYERMSKNYIKFVPVRYRVFVQGLVNDVKNGMNAYFRGQFLVALCVGILFAIGFLIIGFPMAIPLGLFIGMLNFVPYLQVVGFVPTIILSVLEAYNSGADFWSVFIPAVLVFAVVQTIQDAFIVPKIMGNVTGLNGAVILLSLSVWGVLLGFVGLIIALPLTTLLISYYKRYVIGNDVDDAAVPDVVPQNEQNGQTDISQ